MKHIISLAAVLWALAFCEAAQSAVPRQVEVVHALSTPGGKANTPGTLHVDRGGESGKKLQPGEPIHIEMTATKALYITLISVDPHGLTEVQSPDLGATGNLILPGSAVSYPNERTAGAFVARLPAGAVQVLVVATDKPTAQIDGANLLPGAAPLQVSADRSVAVLSRLREQLASGEFGSYQIAPFSYTVQLEAAAQTYSAEQIVTYFAETTRNVARPRLEGWGVNFAFDSAQLLPSSTPELEKWGRVLRDPLLKSQTFVIGGHTDDVGSDPYNNELSMRRAMVVREILVSRYGVAADQIVAKGYGKSLPLVERSNSEGRAMNRRVDFERSTAIK